MTITKNFFDKVILYARFVILQLHSSAAVEVAFGFTWNRYFFNIKEIQDGFSWITPSTS